MTILTPQDIHVAFTLPPAAAVAYLRNKGLQITNHWEDMLDEAHAKAFTVAKVAKLDMLHDIQTHLADAIESGTTRAVATKALQATLVKQGWLSGNKDKIARRLKTIYQTNIQSAYMAGRHQSMLAAQETHPYWRYVAVLDSRTRRTHGALHDRVFKHSDNAWGVAMPPNGWNCRCRVSPMSQAALVQRELKVEDSNMTFIDKEIGVNTRTGEIRTGNQPKTVKVAQITVKDRATGQDIIFSPDVGFNSSPANAWQPDLYKYPTALANAYKAQIAQYQGLKR